ncbi:MAG TPA: ABC transporter permease [Bacillota bacterium]|nr:ABC transporter permease [Bacillota bacterium]
MRRLMAMIKKELIQMRRDPVTLAISIFAPLLMLLLYGYGINFDIRHIPMTICDQDQTQESRDFLTDFPSDYFNVVGITNDPDALDTELDTGHSRIVLWIPHGFGKAMSAGRQGQIYAGIDGADANTANVSLGYLNTIVKQRSNRIYLTRLQRKIGITPHMPLDFTARVWYNPELKSSHFLIPGLVAVLLMMVTTLLTAMTITNEKENNTIEQLVASPIHPIELMLGKMIPCVLSSSLGVLLVIVIGRRVFEVPLKGDLVTLVVSCLLYLMTSLGLGLLISTVSKTQQAAMTIAGTTTMLPSVLLSGYIYPIANMPAFIQLFTFLVPARYFIIILRGIFLKGVGFAVLWPQLLGLGLIATFFTVISASRFHKRLE